MTLATGRGPPGSTIIILLERREFNNNNNNSNDNNNNNKQQPSYPRATPFPFDNELLSAMGFLPHFVGGIDVAKSSLLTPYPAIPPYVVGTSHPGVTDDREHITKQCSRTLTERERHKADVCPGLMPLLGLMPLPWAVAFSPGCFCH